MCLGDQFEWFEAGYTYRVGFLPRTLKAGYLYMLIYVMIINYDYISASKTGILKLENHQKGNSKLQNYPINPSNPL